jgi:HAD superfamily hydrolase (TIGR01549 family)
VVAYRAGVPALALFDLDDTLVDRSAAFRAWVEEFVTAHGLDDTAAQFLLAAHARHTGPMNGFFVTVCRTFTLPSTPDQLWQQYRRRMSELATCRPEDTDALRRLRAAGWRIGIVTNGMPDNQLGKIRNTGLDRLVDAWAISGEVGIRKPDPGIFHLAAERCGSHTTDGWMTGDSLTLDIAGGHAARMRTIWIQPHQPAPSPVQGPAPDATVRSAAAAIGLLLAGTTPMSAPVIDQVPDCEGGR